MAKFNLKDYEPVEERIQRFRRDHEQGRIETSLITFDGEHGATRWVVKAAVYRNAEEPPCGEGHAFEKDGTGMANNTSALENAETSAVGRALAQAGYAGSRRVTQEEMAKVLIGELNERIRSANSTGELNAIWEEAGANNVLNELKAAILKRGDDLKNGG